MTKLPIIQSDKQYTAWIGEVCKRFKQSQIKASIKVNTELLRFYFNLGYDLHIMKKQFGAGNEFYSMASKDLGKALPDVKSFSPTNLKYMQYFFELYGDKYLNIRGQQVVDQNNEISPQLVDLNVINRPQLADDFKNTDIFEIPWGHQVQIIGKCQGNMDKALFYVRKTIENNWSRAVLLNFLDTDLYEREGKAVTNFKETLPLPLGDLAQQIVKDPYNFNFLSLTEKYTEKELKDALMDNIQHFLLELGNGFAFVGREVRIEVGQTEKFIDMLFYNIKLHCYVVLEVKTDKFDFANVGQLGGYMVAVNHQLKGEIDNPTIGLLVCKYKDNVEAQYALESSSQPMGVSAYELSRLIPENFKSTLPSIEEIEAELNGNIKG